MSKPPPKQPPNRSPRRIHNPVHGLSKAQVIGEVAIERILGIENYAQKSRKEISEQELGLSEGAKEARRHMEIAKSKLESKKEPTMTVSLYSSTASGKEEIVVQTNAQSLDLFIIGLADATSEATKGLNDTQMREKITMIFKNSFPLAFAIAGYKADKVTESRMLICGAVTPETSKLLAHSTT